MITEVEAFGGSLDGKIVEVDELFDKNTMTLQDLMKYKIVLESEVYQIKTKKGKFKLVYLGKW